MVDICARCLKLDRVFSVSFRRVQVWLCADCCEELINWLSGGNKMLESKEETKMTLRCELCDVKLKQEVETTRRVVHKDGTIEWIPFERTDKDIRVSISLAGSVHLCEECWERLKGDYYEQPRPAGGQAGFERREGL